MNTKLLELAMRRGVLKARIDAQRLALAEQSAPLENVLARGDAVLEGVDWLKHHPLAIAAAVAAVVVARPRRALRWARRGFFLWRSWQGVRNLLAKSS
ncbi:MAG: YqjK family protein [Azonexus sp.]|nr:YqjK family protein [Azonexus sp.]MDZ4313265.1 YqjK family protein [Azonexus sp.]